MVAQKAIALGFSEEQILSPVKANEVHPLPWPNGKHASWVTLLIQLSHLPGQVSLLHTLMTTTVPCMAESPSPQHDPHSVKSESKMCK